jgi:parallel beta-helix repeat protein
MNRHMLRTMGAVIMAWSLALDVRGADAPMEFFVAPDGADTNAGTAAAPFATLTRARDAARQAGTQAARRIVVRGGRYYDVSLDLDPRDSGLAIVAAPNEKPLLHGGRRVTGWEKDGDRFYAAQLPGVAERTWDFRLLVVNDQLRPRARLPQSGTFTHRSRFDAPWHTTVGGGFRGEDKPELKLQLQYEPGDLGPWLDIHNAELTIYHQWDDSIVGLQSHDPESHMLGFANPAGYPPGAFGVKTYVVWNVREGMQEPGQWYLDRTRGMVVYWPLPGEDLSTLDVIAPTTESVIRIRGRQDEPVTGITLERLGISCTTAPCVSGGFGAGVFAGAVEAEFIRDLRLLHLRIANTGGQGIRMEETADSVVEGCEVTNAGAGGIRLTIGTGNRIDSNRIAGVGRTYASAIGLVVGGGGQTMPGLKRCRDNVVSRNEVCDTPYVGICFSGWRNRYERNLVHHVMNELRDGAAFYGAGQDIVIRGNIVRDIPPGTRAHAYYIDELGANCLVEDNLAVRCEWPIHMHMASTNIVRHNLFIATDASKLTFPRCDGFVMDRNVIVAGGPISVEDADGVSAWTHNLVFSGSGEYRGLPATVQTGDPRLVDAANGDYRFHPDSPAPTLGIAPFEFQNVGPAQTSTR